MCIDEKFRGLLEKHKKLIAFAVMVSTVGLTMLFYSFSKNPVHGDHQSSKIAENLLGIAQTYATNLMNIAIAALVGTTGLILKIWDKRRALSVNELILMAAALSLLGCSIFFGGEAHGRLTDNYSQNGTVQIETGLFAAASGFQFWTLCLGAGLALIAALNLVTGKD
jgi:hypothetical protein